MSSLRTDRRSAGPDTGAALVEAALVLAVVATLVGAVSVVSSGWGRATDLDHLATRAVRMAARVVDAPTTDLDVLAFVAGSLGEADLERLVIYRPADTGGVPTPECAALRPSGTAPAGVPGWCTAFGPGHLAALEPGASVTTGCVPGSWEGAWCPSERHRGVGGDPSWIGVVLEVRPRVDPLVVGSPVGGVLSARAVAALDPPVERQT